MPRSSLLAAVAGWLPPLSACQSGTDRSLAVSTASTGLAIITIDSNVLDGTQFGFKTDRDGLGWPGPRRVPRYRDVPPSLTDQQQVLGRLVKLVLAE